MTISRFEHFLREEIDEVAERAAEGMPKETKMMIKQVLLNGATIGFRALQLEIFSQVLCNPKQMLEIEALFKAACRQIQDEHVSEMKDATDGDSRT